MRAIFGVEIPQGAEIQKKAELEALQKECGGGVSLSQGLTGRTILAEENNIEAIHSQAKGKIEGGPRREFSTRSSYP